MSEAPTVPDIIRSTVDLADQDRATGHLTIFWHQRVLALCELLGGAVAAGAGDPQCHDSPNSLQPQIAALRARNFQRVGAPLAGLTVERLAELLREMPIDFRSDDGVWLREAAWLLPRLGAASPAAAPPQGER